MKPEDIPQGSRTDERLRMSHWYPKLEEADVPVPKTHKANIDWSDDKPDPDLDSVEMLVRSLGGEAFIRSDYKSAAHDLNAGSIINNVHEVENTVSELIFQHFMMSLPVGENVWVREKLDLNFCHYCQGDLHPEVRVFIRDGEVVCHHPRLSSDFDSGVRRRHRQEAIDAIDHAWDREYADYVPEEERRESLKTYAQRVADEFDGNWSVDFVMDTTGDWYATDMALDGIYNLEELDEEGWCSISEHPEDCQHDWENKLDDEYLPSDDDDGGMTIEAEIDEIEEDIDDE